MNEIEAYCGLVLAALVIAVLAKRKDLPYPIALVVGGVLLSLIPDFPNFRLHPDIVFYVLLPPILFEAATFTSWRDFWRWRRTISWLAFGLVGATSAVVAVLCAWLIPGMNLATGFALGAIVSPPDAVAATSITRGMRLPRAVTQILEGESLVNDAAGLTLYRFAVAAVVTGAFSLPEALLSLVWSAAAGVGAGAAMGYLFLKVFPRIGDPEIETVSTFLLAYGSYFAAESMEASGVLSTVTAGILLGWNAPELTSAVTRIRSRAVWETAIFLLNAMIFLLIGLQLPIVVRALSDYPAEWLLLWSTAITIGIIVTRIVWVFLAAYLPRALSARIRQVEPSPSPAILTLIGWTGLRGVVSLAAALALPLETESGYPFPYRDLVLLISFIVILATLVIQGLTIRPLVRWMGIAPDNSTGEEELAARIAAAEAALTYLAEAKEEGRVFGIRFERVCDYYEAKLADLRVEQEASASEAPAAPGPFQTAEEQRLWREVSGVQRHAILKLRSTGQLGDEALNQILRDIDLLDSRLVPASHLK